MVFNAPLWFSRQLLSTFNTRVSLYYAERIPNRGPVVVVSNHRSFMDAPLLMVSLNRSVRFASHRYMGQVPLLREIVQKIGAFPLDSQDSPYRALFEQASQFLDDQQAVGIFPEGGQPMIQVTQPNQIGDFHRGFAHLVLRSPLPNITLLPVAIASCEESIHSVFPLRVFHWFDPSEPLFDQPGWHPMVIYHRVKVLIGKPISISENQRSAYHGKQARTLTHELTQTCHDQIEHLLYQGFHMSDHAFESVAKR